MRMYSFLLVAQDDAPFSCEKDRERPMYFSVIALSCLSHMKRMEPSDVVWTKNRCRTRTVSMFPSRRTNKTRQCSGRRRW